MADETRRNTDKIALRLPEGMRDRIAALADKNNRSTNAEIVARLEASLDGEAGTGSAEPSVSLVDEIEGLRAQIRYEAIERRALESKVYHIDQRLYAVEIRS